MASRRPSRVIVVLTCAVVVVGVAAVAWLVLRERSEDSRAGPFRESATEAGLTWQMTFLQGEQGQNFKINLYDHGCGLAVADFDGDGREDIYFCNQLGKNALYRNKGDGTFEEVAARAGVSLGDRVCVAAAFADTRNNGLQDLFVTSTRGGNVFFRNKGDGTFEDATQEAGLAYVGHSQTAVFFDFDNDGYLDLFVTNTAHWTSNENAGHHFAGAAQWQQLIESPLEHNILYHNNRDGTFTDVTAKAGLAGKGWGGDVAVFDYDNDGRLDLLVTNMFGMSQLYHNNGDGTFTDVTRKVLGRTCWGAIGSRAFDAHNHGRLDLYIVDMHSDMWMGVDRKHESLSIALQAQHRKFDTPYGPFWRQDPGQVEDQRALQRRMGYKPEDVVYGNVFYRNEGDGKFTEVSDQAGLETFWPWGIATGDFDNDGWEDVFLPSGMGYPYYYWPNQLLMNQGDGTFRERAAELGLEPPPRGQTLQPIGDAPAVRSSRCAVTGDFRNVGLLDLVVNNFNDQPYYFKNQMPRRNSIAFRLTGTSYKKDGTQKKTSRDAVGAVVRLYRGDQVLTRQVQGAGGYLSQSSRTLHFGLGDRPDIDRVVIAWPSGVTQELKSFTVNTMNKIDEPERDVR